MTEMDVRVIEVLLFVIALSCIGVWWCVSSKYYGARYYSKDEVENLKVNAKVRRVVGQLFDDEETKKKLAEFLAEDE